MADKRISQLVDRGTVANNDVVPIVVSGAVTTNKATISSIQTFMQENLDVGVTSVGITLGSAGTDVNVTGSPITTSGNITINIPDASATARGVVNTGTQTFAGYKIFTGTIGVNQDIQLATQGTALNTFIKNINATGLTSIGSNGFGFNNSNNIYFSGSSKGGGVLAFSNTGTQTYTLQNASGTLAFTSDIPSLAGYVTLDTAQNISGVKTFTGGALRVSSGGLGGLPTRIVSAPVSSVALSGFNSIGFNGSNNLFITRESDTNGVILAFNNTDLRTYTLPDASGTIALTSNLGAYLPLTGGTLTGALNGTSASFTGNVSSGGIFIGRTTNGQAFGVGNGVDTDLGIFVQTNNILFSNSGASSGYAFAVGGSTRFSISSTGAATFSNSVTANTFLRAASGAQSNPTGGASVAIDYQSTSDIQGRIRSRDWDGGVWKNLTLEANNILLFPNGNVGIGTASPNYLLHIAAGASNPQLQFSSTGTGSTTSDGFHIGVNNSTLNAFLLQKENADLQVFTNDTERMRITSGGNVLVSNGGQTDGALIVGRNGNNNSILAVSDANNTTEAYFRGFSTAVSASRIVIFSNGNIVNTNNSYGALSDIKLKENIEDATPKLNDLLKVKVRNYNLMGEDKKQIGVIAQELEEVFPAMIDESEDFEEVEVTQLDEEGNEVLNEEGEVVTEKQRVSKGTFTKSVKYSVFVPMLIKAMQEQQEQIKVLTEQIDSLKNQIK